MNFYSYLEEKTREDNVKKNIVCVIITNKDG